MNNSKVFGSIFLIVGTSIGAGMLAIPIISAQSGFWGSLLLLISCWFVMTAGAFLILEVNLCLPRHSNLISMAKKTLGNRGAILTWFAYLLLLYSLLASYIGGGADVLQALIINIHNISLPLWLSATLFLLVLGSIVYSGIESTDYVNRVLMSLKLLLFTLLIIFILPHVHFQQLHVFGYQHLIPAITVVLASFGFATIVPSLRSYLQEDIRQLKRVILIGSLIPLICYILWVTVVLGKLPLTGENGLLAILQSGQSTSHLTASLIFYIQNPWLASIIRFFTTICILTAFLGVSLGLVDFLADGLNLKKQGWEKLWLHLLAFVPPFIIVLVYPKVFILALSYAGVFCAILLMLLPAVMAWASRYRLSLPNTFNLPGGKPLLIAVILAAIFVAIQDIVMSMHLLP